MAPRGVCLEKEFPGVSLPVWANSNNSAKSDLRACAHHVVLETNMGHFPVVFGSLFPSQHLCKGMKEFFWGFGAKVVKMQNKTLEKLCRP